MRAELIAVGETARYKERASPCWEGLNKGGDVRYTLSSSKDFWHLSVQTNAFLSVLKNGRHLLVAR